MSAPRSKCYVSRFMPPENQNEPKLKKVENVSCLDTADEKVLNVKNPDSHEGSGDVQSAFTMTSYVMSNMRFKSGKTKGSKRVNALVLLDSQSTGNFITSEFLKKIPYVSLGPIRCKVRTLTGSTDFDTEQVQISPTVAGQRLNIVATVVKDGIGEHPIQCPSVNNVLPFVPNTIFNHRCEAGQRAPDLLVNSALCYHWVIGPPVRFKYYPDLTLLNTREGAIFIGSIKTNCSCNICTGSSYQTNVISSYPQKREILANSYQSNICTKADSKTLNKNVEKLLELEKFKDDHIDSLSASDSEALRKLKESIKFVKGVSDHPGALGSYEVGQIWKTEEPPVFFNNYTACHARWKKAEQQILRLPVDQQEAVIESIERHIRLNQYVKATPEEVARYSNLDTNCFFLPARIVLSKSDSTPARYCLDGSAPSGKRGPSVNSAQLKSVCSLPCQRVSILRWRAHRIAYLCDISKFFLSILMRPEDQKYQLMLYKRPGTPGEPEIYICKRVIFGLRSSPGICDFVLRYHLDKVANDPKQTEACRRVARKVSLALYADNWMSGSQNLEDVIQEVEALNKILLQANMKMCKYGSHSKELLESIPEELRAPSDHVSFGQSTSQENGVGFVMGQDQMDILGMSYSHLKDEFNFGGYRDLIKDFDLTKPLSKRQLASAAAKPGFDLIGVRSPFVVMARNLLQETFKITKIDPKTGDTIPMEWDDPLPPSIDTKFKQWLEQLPELDNISIPRYIPINETSTAEILVDAGEAGICTHALIRTKVVDENGKAKFLTSFAYATCKVRSISSELSIPRLELAALLVGTRVGQMLQKAFDLESHKVRLWSDSLVSIAWTKKTADELSPWHLNRVKVINESGFQLRYIPSELNSSDLGTKEKLCVTPSMLKTREWLKGPTFFEDDEKHWPDFLNKKKYLERKDPDFLEGIRKARLTVMSTKTQKQKFVEKLINDILVRTNSYIKVKKILAILILATYHLPLHQPWPKRKPEEPNGWREEQFVHIIKSAKFVFIPKPKKQTVGITRSQYKKFFDKASTHKELPSEEEIKQYQLSPGFPYYSKKFEKLSAGEKIENLQQKEKQIAKYRERKSKLLPKAVARHKSASKQTKDYHDPFVEQTPVPDNYVNYNYNMTHAMKQADFLLFSYSQHKYFEEEISRLRNKRPISVNSSLIGLNPQLVKKYGVHLLISKGRLAHALILERENTPIILSNKCIITKNYLRYIHETFHHASRNFLYKFCRNSIYVPKATNLCKYIIRNCIDCEKMRAKVRPNKMQALPDVRIDIDNVTKSEKLQGHVGIAVNA